ncbi:androgen-dependent TFPI-regulating protein [Budorcas taxicolor]|uniref:androgen-dependent TFPI-regulating protein n=1 Tax=Budorcas taxicolor TaxID=37181 RepID=UPI0022850317|nr:androgen-dependent TFPI-regulating protein [Budorcas taxicolor]
MARRDTDKNLWEWGGAAKTLGLIDRGSKVISDFRGPQRPSEQDYNTIPISSYSRLCAKRTHNLFQQDFSCYKHFGRKLLTALCLDLATTRTSTCVYHLFVLSWYIFLNFYISPEGEDPRISLIFQNGGKWKYLTLLNLLLQAIFFGVACLEDVLKRTKGEKDIKFITAFRDLLFTTLAFPVSTFVFLSFWIIFLYDRELIYPKVLDTIFPVWLNHAMHTFILPFSLVEVILRPHSYPLRKKGLTLLTAAGLTYVSRILWIYSETGTWVYPMFAKLSPVALAALFSLSHIFVIGIYLFGEKLNHWKWESFGSKEHSVTIPSMKKWTQNLPLLSEDLRFTSSSMSRFLLRLKWVQVTF